MRKSVPYEWKSSILCIVGPIFMRTFLPIIILYQY